MSKQRKLARILILLAIGTSLTACHFHRHGGCRGFSRPVISFCR